MAKKKVQAVSFDDLKKLVVNEAKNNNNVLPQEQIDEYLMNYDLSDELAEELQGGAQKGQGYLAPTARDCAQQAHGRGYAFSQQDGLRPYPRDSPDDGPAHAVCASVGVRPDRKVQRYL